MCKKAACHYVNEILQPRAFLSSPGTKTLHLGVKWGVNGSVSVTSRPRDRLVPFPRLLVLPSDPCGKAMKNTGLEEL